MDSPLILPSTSVPGDSPLTKDPRTETLGTVCLVLGILEGLYAGIQAVSALTGSLIVGYQKKMLMGMPRAGSGPSPATMMVGAEQFMRRIAVFNTLRFVPFLVATTVLIVIALQLRQGNPLALARAKTWTWCAVGCVAFSALVQGGWILPAQLEYQQGMLKRIPSFPSGSPTGVLEPFQTMTSIFAVASVVIGSVFLVAWPIAMHFWIRHIEKTTRQQEQPSD